AAGRCNLVDCPAAGGIGFEEIERPLERAGYQLRSHGGTSSREKSSRNSKHTQSGARWTGVSRNGLPSLSEESEHLQSGPCRSASKQRSDAMSQQGQWQVTGSAAEVYEKELVPSIFGPWAQLVVDL